MWRASPTTRVVLANPGGAHAAGIEFGLGPSAAYRDWYCPRGKVPGNHEGAWSKPERTLPGLRVASARVRPAGITAHGKYRESARGYVRQTHERSHYGHHGLIIYDHDEPTTVLMVRYGSSFYGRTARADVVQWSYDASIFLLWCLSRERAGVEPCPSN